MKNKITSNRLNYNAGIMSWYTKELQSLVSSMIKECKSELAEIYKKGYPDIAFDESISSQARIALNQLYKKYGDKFSDKGKKLAENLIKKTNRYSNWQINQRLKEMLGTNAKDFVLKGSAITPEKSEIMKAILFENVSLIKSIHNEYFKQITGAVARSIENGEGVKWLAKELISYGAKTERRAQLIAQDQTRKAYTSINLRNFQENNVKRVKWMHSGGSRDPREYHKTPWDGVSGIKDGEPNGLDGYIFDIDKPPVIDKKTGKRGYPGQLPYCRCTLAIVLDFEE